MPDRVGRFQTFNRKKASIDAGLEGGNVNHQGSWVSSLHSPWIRLSHQSSILNASNVASITQYSFDGGTQNRRATHLFGKTNDVAGIDFAYALHEEFRPNVECVSLLVPQIIEVVNFV